MAGTYGQVGVTYGQAGGTYGDWGSTAVEEQPTSTGGRRRRQPRRPVTPRRQIVVSGGHLHIHLELSGTPGPTVDIAGTAGRLTGSGALEITAAASHTGRLHAGTQVRYSHRADTHARLRGAGTRTHLLAVHAALTGRSDDPDLWLLLDLPELA